MIFEHINFVYDKLYSDKLYEQEFNHVKDIILKFNPGNKVLEYGSGTGKYSEFFINDGFTLTGIEISPKMHELAIKKGINSINNSMVDYKSEEKYDNAISMFHVFSYLNLDKEIDLFFKNLENNLTENGLFIFDAWYTPSVMKTLPSKRTKDYEDSSIKISRKSYPTIIPKKNIVSVKFVFDILYKDSGEKYFFEEVHDMRHFSIPEIINFSKKYNFEYLFSEELISKKIPSENTWSLLHILKKT